MRRSIIITIITALLTLVGVSVASAAVPAGVQNWQNMDAGMHPRSTWMSNQMFRIRNHENGKLLGYGHETYGVDLQWGDHGDWMLSLPGHGQTRAQGLRQCHQVRDDPVPLMGVHRSGAADSGLRLVGDQQHAALDAEFLEPGQVPRRRFDDPAGGQDRLDETRRQAAG